MIETLGSLDRKIFIAIHQDMANDLFDVVFPLLREPLTWIPLYLFFGYMAVKKYKLEGFYVLLATGFVVLLCDQFSASIMKPLFERLRPCHEPTLTIHIRHLVNCGGQYGFISSHATNHFGMAVLFTWFFKNISSKTWLNWIFYTWAALICFAQVYVAKHYLGDVLAGMLFGILIGKLVLSIFTKIVMIKKISSKL